MVIDLVTQHMVLNRELIQLLGDRHIGVGFDQLLLVEPPTRPDVDFRYRILIKTVARWHNVVMAQDVLQALCRRVNYRLNPA